MTFLWTPKVKGHILNVELILLLVNFSKKSEFDIGWWFGKFFSSIQIPDPDQANNVTQSIDLHWKPINWFLDNCNHDMGQNEGQSCFQNQNDDHKYCEVYGSLPIMWIVLREVKWIR